MSDPALVIPAPLSPEQAGAARTAPDALAPDTSRARRIALAAVAAATP